MILRFIRRLLGEFGFDYCPKCGLHKVFLYKHGYWDNEVWACPRCDKRQIKEYREFKKNLSRKGGE